MAAKANRAKKGVNGGYVLIIHIAIPSHRRYERAFEMSALAGQLITQARVGIARQWHSHDTPRAIVLSSLRFVLNPALDGQRKQD
jgi:hypothetical protein